MSQQFEWDADKAARNKKKHGIAFEDAMTVFADPLAQIFDDPDHSVSEKRAIIVGNSVASHLLVVGFTERQGTVRVINARAATVRERRHYEKDSETSKGK
jgi:uncharacterized DUF497 family protein